MEQNPLKTVTIDGVEYKANPDQKSAGNVFFDILKVEGVQ